MNKISFNLTRIATFTGIALGAFALSAFAGPWVAPTSAPTNGNVDAPINAGSLLQFKNGLLGVIGLATQSLQVTAGAGTDKLLTSDTTGNATWKTLGATMQHATYDHVFCSDSSGNGFGSPCDSSATSVCFITNVDKILTTGTCSISRLTTDEYSIYRVVAEMTGTTASGAYVKCDAVCLRF